LQKLNETTKYFYFVLTDGVTLQNISQGLTRKNTNPGYKISDSCKHDVHRKLQHLPDCWAEFAWAEFAWAEFACGLWLAVFLKISSRICNKIQSKKRIIELLKSLDATPMKTTWVFIVSCCIWNYLLYFEKYSYCI
jgi:hypothetical protein